MTTIKKAYADTPLGQIHYRYSLPAAGSPPQDPLLLLHMSASSSASMEALMQKLTPLGHPCYAPDMPGFGGSFDPNEDPPNIAWYIELYIQHLLPAIGLPKGGFHLIGHHSGAVIGLEIAVTYPSLLKSLVSIGPAVMSAEQRAEMRKIFHSPFNQPEEMGAYLIKTFDYVSRMPHGVPPSKLELLHRETLDHIRAWKGRSQIYNCVWNQDSQALLEQVRVPVLPLCARDDVLWDFVEEFERLRPDLKVKEIEGGNFGPDLGVESITKEVKKWLEGFA